MTNIAKRITELRDERGLGRTQLASELGFPKMSVEKFETGRLTPSKDQQEKLANYFGVSIEYLRGESDDRTTMRSWLSGNFVEEPEPVKPAAAPKAKIVAQSGVSKATDDSALFSALLRSDAFQKAVLEALQTPEGKALIKRLSL